MIEEYSIGQLIQFILLIGIFLFTLFSRREAAKTAEVKELTDRLTKLEIKVEYLPTSNQFSQLLAEVRELNGKQEAMNNTLVLINESLINNGIK
ncbi:DUF2730 domain-containing protein [Entomomonas sp. E2T0]|uniref:DUF2730 domain-containing protein n=1 Tax=Entomomonas sp. E2T0 TaxID=2930213 RepID=UPI002228114F|nr:DUF2730 domain-containing protein [Entomomonas sp. E2T0]UYZ84298.1 DUF2730 domain-containing protein [Entomomonas sp. E2T0]